MSSTFGVAGTGPTLADFSSRVNVLLMNAVKTNWNLVVWNNVTPPITYPAESDIIFINSWFTGASDVEMVFKLNFEDIPTAFRGSTSTDWRYQQHIVTVDTHIGVRSGGDDQETSVLNTVVNGLDKIIATNATTLIPNAICKLASTQQGPSEKLNDRQTWYHVLCKVRVIFWKVRTC